MSGGGLHKRELQGLKDVLQLSGGGLHKRELQGLQQFETLFRTLHTVVVYYSYHHMPRLIANVDCTYPYTSCCLLHKYLHIAYLVAIADCTQLPTKIAFIYIFVEGRYLH